jgi:DtxR family Mn-dependent transcriptional regulator
MSESNEMYLLRTALLQRDGQPVPLSLLAQELAVSTVSANEMCRKLMHDGLLIYEPYKGVTLTPQGAAIARRVLRRRRLWEVFLVTQLHLDPDEADTIACRLEHVTPDMVADRLDALLEYPRYTARYAPIPPGAGDTSEPPPLPLPLLALGVGETGTIAEIRVDTVTAQALRAQGLAPGTRVTVLAAGAGGPLLLDLAGQSYALVHRLAEQMTVVPVG